MKNDQLEKRLEIVHLLMGRFDGLRAATANRSAIIVSANAFLVAASTFLIDSTAPNCPTCTSPSNMSLSIQILGVASIIVLVASTLLALLALGYILKRSTGKWGISSDKRLLYHASSTIKVFGTPPKNERPPKTAFERFYGHLEAVPVETLLLAASTELWNGINEHDRRYNLMRWSIILLAISVMAILAASVLLVIRNFTIAAS